MRRNAYLYMDIHPADAMAKETECVTTYENYLDGLRRQYPNSHFLPIVDSIAKDILANQHSTGGSVAFGTVNGQRIIGTRMSYIPYSTDHSYNVFFKLIMDLMHGTTLPDKGRWDVVRGGANLSGTGYQISDDDQEGNPIRIPTQLALFKALDDHKYNYAFPSLGPVSVKINTDWKSVQAGKLFTVGSAPTQANVRTDAAEPLYNQIFSQRNVASQCLPPGYECSFNADCCSLSCNGGNGPGRCF